MNAPAESATLASGAYGIVRSVGLPRWSAAHRGAYARAVIERRCIAIALATMACGARDAAPPAEGSDASTSDSNGSGSGSTTSSSGSPSTAVEPGSTGGEASSGDAPVLPDAGVAPSCLPFGMANAVVTVGGLTDGARENWVRLGTYVFSCDDSGLRSVSAAYWRYNQTTARPTRESTGIVGADCTPAQLDCELRTTEHFATTDAAPEGLDGTFVVVGDELEITWASGLIERWTGRLTDDGLLARFDLEGSEGFDRPPTAGWAYASNRPLDEEAAITDIAAAPPDADAGFRFGYSRWNRDTVASDDVDYILSTWSPCEGGECMGRTGCRTVGVDAGCGASFDPHWCDPGQSPMMFYTGDLPASDRRNVYEFWTLCLAEGRDEICYTGNSHTLPLLQIIDDAGAFRGWVGVEVSPGYDAGGDYIGVVRLANF